MQHAIVNIRVVLFSMLLSSGLFPLATIQARFAASAPEVPEPLRPPKGESLILQLHGKGDQIYVCRGSGGAYTWQLKGPDAKLFGESGELAGRHFAGPAWEANDGSRVTGKAAASVPSPDSSAIPWLLLSVTSHDGNGIMSGVRSIQRLDTKGGKAPVGACSGANESEEQAVPYEADYFFYGTTPAAGLAKPVTMIRDR